MKKIVSVGLLLLTVANCTDYEQAVEVGKTRCDMVGYQLDKGELERVAGLGCIERQANGVMATATQRVNLGISVATAGAVINGL